jgi:hypothetical protein
MLELSKPITDKLLKKGFSLEEIPKLVNDLTNLIRESRICTTYDINLELENLGWGIQIIDESLYDEFLKHLNGFNETVIQN